VSASIEWQIVVSVVSLRNIVGWLIRKLMDKIRNVKFQCAKAMGDLRLIYPEKSLGLVF